MEKFTTRGQQFRMKLLVEVLLYGHINRSFIRDGSPWRPPRLSHSSWVLYWECTSGGVLCTLYLLVCQVRVYRRRLRSFGGVLCTLYLLVCQVRVYRRRLRSFSGVLCTLYLLVCQVRIYRRWLRSFSGVLCTLYLLVCQVRAYRRWLRSFSGVLCTLYLLVCQVRVYRSISVWGLLLMCLCDIFRALINSLVCWLWLASFELVSDLKKKKKKKVVTRSKARLECATTTKSATKMARAYRDLSSAPWYTLSSLAVDFCDIDDLTL